MSSAESKSHMHIYRKMDEIRVHQVDLRGKSISEDTQEMPQS